MGAEIQGSFFSVSQAHQQEVGLEVDQSEFELVLQWGATNAGISLIYHTTMQSSKVLYRTLAKFDF